MAQHVKAMVFHRAFCVSTEEQPCTQHTSQSTHPFIITDSLPNTAKGKYSLTLPPIACLMSKIMDHMTVTCDNITLFAILVIFILQYYFMCRVYLISRTVPARQVVWFCLKQKKVLLLVITILSCPTPAKPSGPR